MRIDLPLTRASGLGHDFRELDMERIGLTGEAAVPLIARIPYDFEPGEKFGYINTGNFLLARIVEKTL